jgi:hypothetical protein
MEIIVSADLVASRIYKIHGKRVILDKDLARLYGVRPIALRQQIKRNRDRFPEDFMFQLTEHEVSALVSQNVIPSRSMLGGYLPLVFTEQGVAMLSSVLNSKRAILVNIQIMRAFVSLRRIGVTYTGLKRKIEDMEKRYDKQFAMVFEAIKQLLEPPPVPKKPPIGFHA